MPFFRHPRSTTQDVPIIERAINNLVDEGSEGEDFVTSQLGPTAKVSSYVGLRPATPPALSTPDTFPNIRHPESVYYQPSGDQLAETLKVIMMNQSSMTPLPIEYNSCVLHVLEAYQQLREGFSTREAALEALKQQHLKDIRTMEALKVEWDDKEINYKADIKRLEVLLSETEGGMERVIEERRRSSVHGTVKMKNIVERSVSTMKERSIATILKTHGSVESTAFGRDQPVNQKSLESPAIDRERNIFLDKRQMGHPGVATAKPLLSYIHNAKERSLITRLHAFPKFPDGNLRTRVSPKITESIQQPREPLDHRNLTKDHLEAIDRQKLEEEFGVSFHSSISSADSSTLSSNDQGVRGKGNKGHDICEKAPLVQNPAQEPILGNNITFERSPPADAKDQAPLTQMGFSFQPGDDTDLFTGDTANIRVIKKQLHEQILQRSYGQSKQFPKPLLESHPAINSKPRLNDISMPSPTAQRKLPANRPILSSGRFDSEPLSRDGSSSSIVTAIRHNSSHSVNGSRKSSGGPVGNEAATAAARAFNGAVKKGEKHRLG